MDKWFYLGFQIKRVEHIIPNFRLFLILKKSQINGSSPLLGDNIITSVTHGSGSIMLLFLSRGKR